MKALPRKGIAAITGIGLAITLTGCTFGEAEPAEYTTREVSDGTTDFVVVENPGGGETPQQGSAEVRLVPAATTPGNQGP